MTRTGLKWACGALIAAAIVCESAHAQNSAGPQGPEEGVIRRQTWLIPAQDYRTMMRTTVFRPPGDGPFPLAVINHGSTQNEMRRAAYPAPQYRVLTEWLVARGYAVAIPQRPGHGETGGPYYEGQGGCADANFEKAGLGAASSIAAAVDFMVRQKFVRKTGVAVMGQSAGGWGALALGSQNFRPVGSVVVFSAGLGGRADDVAGRNCAPDRLIATARSFGAKTRVPTLWLYSSNDSYFPPALSKKLAQAFLYGGGRAEYRLLPPYGTEGHDFIQSPEAVEAWGSVVEKFLKTAKPAR